MLPRNCLKLRTLLPFIALTTAASAFAADDEHFVVREYSFPLTGIEEVELHGSVGSMRIVPIEGNEVRLVLEIEGSDEGWFGGDRDVSEVELDSDVRGKRLVLRQTEEDTNTEWTVQLPAVARTTINFGVGDARLRGADDVDRTSSFVSQDIEGHGAGTLDARINVGVGDVTVTLE